MLSNDRFNAIQAFVQAEACGSFSAAAARMGLSQSAVGKAIARLEARLGVRLFNRTTRHLSLTNEGRAYHASCLRALNELEAAETVIAERRVSPAGSLRMNLPDLFGRRLVMPVLLDLARHHPALTLDISFDNRFVDLADEGFDLVVRIGNLGDTAGLIARKLGVQRLQTYAAPVYLAEHAPLTSPADLGDHRCITQGRHGREEPWLFLERGEIRRIVVHGRHRFAALDAMAEAAAAGMGIVQLPSWLAAGPVMQGRLVPVFTNLKQPELPVQALWLQARTMVPRIRATVDALVVHFENTGIGATY